MRHPEDLLPPDLQFDTAAQDCREEIIADAHATLENYGDIIDPNVELTRDSQVLWDWSCRLDALMKTENENIEAVQSAMYRGTCFALQIVDNIKSAPIPTVSPYDVMRAHPDENLDEAILLMTSQYASERQHIDNLLGNFMPELDTSHFYGHHIETAAMMMFMLCERGQGDAYLQSMFEYIEPKDI